MNIYNGYYIDNMSFLKLHKWINRVRDDSKVIAKKLKRKNATIMVYRIINLYKLTKENMYSTSKLHNKLDEYENKNNVLWFVNNDITERQNNLKEHLVTDEEVDFRFSLVFIPRQNRILMLVYTVHDEYKAYIEKYKFVHEYRYWNGTDPDPNISKKEWKKRFIEWDTGLKTGIPALDGFSVDIVLNEYMEQCYNIVDYSIENQVMDIIDNVIEYYYDTNVKNIHTLDDYTEFRHWKEENKPIKEDLIKRITEVIK